MEDVEQRPAGPRPQQPGARCAGRPAQLHRRRIAAGFAVTAEPLLAQAIKTPMDGLEGGDAKIGDIPAYYAVKKGSGKRPVVIVVAEIWGLHEYMKDMCRRLAKAGYFAVSNEPFFRIGELWKLTDIKEVLAGANAAHRPAGLRGPRRGAWPGRRSSTRANARSSASPAIAAAAAWCGCTPRTRRRSTPASPGTAASARATPAKPLTPVDVTDKIDRAGARPLRRRRPGIPHERCRALRAGLHAFGNDKKSHDPRLPRHAARLPRRLPADLPQGAADDGWKRMLAWFKKNGVA